MDKSSPITALAEAYGNHPAAQALIALIPGSGSLTPLLEARAAEIAHERTRAFFDEFSKGQIEITPELVRSEDFLHAYFSTLRAVAHTRQRQKIRYLARLFRSALLGGDFRDGDDYEELLGTLDELSFRELRGLAILDNESESGDMTTDDNRVKWRDRIRNRFLSELAVSNADLPAFSARLQRSGLFNVPGMHVGDHGYLVTTTDKLAGFGELTPRYYRLRALVGELDADA